MADEWYRSAEWEPGEFEERMRRARPWSRPQYLRVKALALMESGDATRLAVAISLLERLDSEADATERPTTPEWLGDAHALDGQFDRAATSYIEAVERQRHANVRGNAPFSLARMVLRARLADRYDATLAILTSEPFPWLAMNWHLFERASATAQLADRLDQPDLAQRAAREALHLVATRTAPEFSRHPDVGLIDVDDATLDELRRIAAPG